MATLRDRRDYDLDYEDDRLRSPRSSRTVRRIVKYRDDDLDDYDDYDSILDGPDLDYRSRHGGRRGHFDEPEIERITVRDRSVSRHGPRETVETTTTRRLAPYDYDDDFDRRARHAHSHSVLRPDNVEETRTTRIVERHSSAPIEVEDDLYERRRRSPSVSRDDYRITERVDRDPRHRDDSRVREEITITEHRDRSRASHHRRRYSDDEDDHVSARIKITESRDRHHNHSPEVTERIHITERRDDSRRGHSSDVEERIKITEHSRRGSSPDTRSVREDIKITDRSHHSSPERKEIRITERTRRGSSHSPERKEVHITERTRRESSHSPERKEVRITERTRRESSHSPERKDIHITAKTRRDSPSRSRSGSRDRSVVREDIKITESRHSPSRSRSSSPKRHHRNERPKELNITETHYNADGTKESSKLQIKEGPSKSSTRGSVRNFSDGSNSPTRSVKSVRISVEEDRKSTVSNDSRQSHHTQGHHHRHHSRDEDVEIERIRRTEEFIPPPAIAPTPIIIRDHSPPQPIIIRQEPVVIERTIERERSREPQQVRDLVRQERPRNVEEDDYYYERQVRKIDHSGELQERRDHHTEGARSRSRHHHRDHREHRDHHRHHHDRDEEDDVIIRRKVKRISRSPSPSTSPASHRRHLLEGALGGAALGELVRQGRISAGQAPGSHLASIAGGGALGALGVKGLSKFQEYNRQRSKSRGGHRRRDDDRYDDDDYDDRHRHDRRGRSKSMSGKEALLGLAGVAAVAGLGALAYKAGKKNTEKTIAAEDGRGRSRHREDSTVFTDDRATHGSHGAQTGKKMAQAGLAGGAMAAVATAISRSRSRSRHGRSGSKISVKDGIPIVGAGLASAAAIGALDKFNNHRKDERRRSKSAGPSVRPDDFSMVQYGDSPIPVDEHQRHSQSRVPTPEYERSRQQSQEFAYGATGAGIGAMAGQDAQAMRERRRAERERRRAARAAGETPTSFGSEISSPPPSQFYQPTPAPGFAPGYGPPPNIYAPTPHPGAAGPPPVVNTTGPYNPAEFGPTQGPTLPTQQPYHVPPPPPGPPGPPPPHYAGEPSPGTIPPHFQQQQPYQAPYQAPYHQPPPPADPSLNAPQMRQDRRQMYGDDSPVSPLVSPMENSHSAPAPVPVQHHHHHHSQPQTQAQAQAQTAHIPQHHQHIPSSQSYHPTYPAPPVNGHVQQAAVAQPADSYFPPHAAATNNRSHSVVAPQPIVAADHLLEQYPALTQSPRSMSTASSEARSRQGSISSTESARRRKSVATSAATSAPMSRKASNASRKQSTASATQTELTDANGNPLRNDSVAEAVEAFLRGAFGNNGARRAESDEHWDQRFHGAEARRNVGTFHRRHERQQQPQQQQQPELVVPIAPVLPAQPVRGVSKQDSLIDFMEDWEGPLEDMTMFDDMMGMEEDN